MMLYTDAAERLVHACNLIKKKAHAFNRTKNEVLQAIDRFRSEDLPGQKDSLRQTRLRQGRGHSGREVQLLSVKLEVTCM